MARIFLIAALIASLAISYVLAADVPVKVGGPAGQLIFDPSVANVQPGDTVTFTWVSGKHSVVQSDAAKSCVKSLTLNDISQAATDVVGTKYVYTVPKNATGKMWYFCGVPGHCQAGMYGTLVVGGSSAPSSSGAPSSGAGSPTSSGASEPSSTASGSGSAASPSGTATKSSAKRIDSNIAIAGAMAAVGLIGLMI